jgi:hypothetical protein
LVAAAARPRPSRRDGEMRVVSATLLVLNCRLAHGVSVPTRTLLGRLLVEPMQVSLFRAVLLPTL